MKRVLISVIITMLMVAAKAQVTGIKSAIAINPDSIKVAFNVIGSFVPSEQVQPAGETSFPVNLKMSRALLNLGNWFSLANNEFFVPVDGIYHFDARITWAKFTTPGLVELILGTDASSKKGTTIAPGSTQTSFDVSMSTLISLKRGERIKLFVAQKSGQMQNCIGVQLCCYKVY